MNLRNSWRLLSRVASSFSVVDRPVARPGGRVVLFSCHDVDRAMSEGGLRFSPLLEGIREMVEQLGFACVNLTHPYASLRSTEVKDGTITVNYRALAIRLLAAAMRVAGRPPAQARFEHETRLYARVLMQLQPQIVFSIQPPAALCRAASRAGVRVIEAMHGTNISLADKVFGSHMAQPDELLPQVILSFDDVSQATLLALCARRGITALRAFDPWLHSCRRRQAPAGADTTPGDKRVLVTLQWGYDGERATLANIIPNGVLHPVLEEAIAATEGRGITFWLRLHPIQMNAPGYRHHRRHVEALAARYRHVEFEHPTKWPLPLLLDEVSAHVTMSSSSVGEAAVAGVPSLMLCPTLRPGGAHHGLFRELESAGSVTFGSLDAQAITNWIEQWPARSAPAERVHEAERRQQSELRFYSALIEPSAAGRAVLDRLDRCEDVQ